MISLLKIGCLIQSWKQQSHPLPLTILVLLFWNDSKIHMQTYLGMTCKKLSYLVMIKVILIFQITFSRLFSKIKSTYVQKHQIVARLRFD